MKALREALWDHITADTAIMALASGVHHYEAPQDAAPPPYVVFEQVGGLPEWTFAGPAMEDLRWIFEGVCTEGDAGPAEELAALLDARLTDAPLTIVGAGLLWLRRASMVEYQRRDGADRYFHSGGVYRVVTQPN